MYGGREGNSQSVSDTGSALWTAISFMLRPELLPEATDCLQSLVGLHSSDGQRLQWQLTATGSGFGADCGAAVGRVTNGYSSGGSQQVLGSGNRTWSLEPTAFPAKEAQICVLCDDRRTERGIACW